MVTVRFPAERNWSEWFASAVFFGGKGAFVPVVFPSTCNDVIIMQGRRLLIRGESSGGHWRPGANRAHAG